MVTVYLDTCCLNRPFDDQSQSRIHLEAEAVLLILLYHKLGYWEWVSSEVVDYEIEQNSAEAHRMAVRELAGVAAKTVRIKETITRRATKIETWGIDGFDALHLACAESARVSVFLTTDDKLVKKSKKYQDSLRVRVENPLAWIQEMEKK